jgi:DNA repair protein SbcD/Mre11
MVRFLHTADWHLGRSFFGASLIDDQAHALDQLVRAAVDARVDAVFVAGDVYDRSTPSADAVCLLDETLTRLVLEHGIPVVVIAGNHDSAARLGFGSRLLCSKGLHVAAGEPCRVQFGDAHGSLDVVAIPFAEPAAVATRLGDEAIDDHDRALRADVAAAVAAIAAQRQSAAAAAPAGKPATSAAPRRKTKNTSAGGRTIAVAHAFVTGGRTSESERPLVLGNAALVGADCFDGLSYVALGHLHRPQPVGRAEVRYSGSLLKYSFDEADHRKSISIVEIDGVGACRLEEIRLSARHDVRVLEGTLAELQRFAETDSCRDDYVMVKLADRGAVIDSIGKLRALYPNCLRVDHTAFFASRGGDPAGRGDLRRHSERELFERFFVEVTGEALTPDESRAFGDALVAATRASFES